MTDGIVEAKLKDPNRVGVEHLVDHCRRHATSSPAELLDSIFDSVEQSMSGEEQHDDMAAAILYFAE
jgi:serine phosphatase RsbU (regulator of sigma subunit)